MPDTKNWSLRISDDRMSAELQVEPDAELTAEELGQALRAAGVVFGRDEEAVSQALRNRGEITTIARGQAPSPGRDARLCFHADEGFFREIAAASVATDLRQQVIVPSVSEGQLLAEVIPAEQGTAGMNIMGREVPPPRPAEINLRALKGVELSADRRKISAVIAGRPGMEWSGNNACFQVLPFYVQRGDVDNEVGHLTFNGDITIMGNVTEGTAVSATGSVEVYGNVIGARITSGHSIGVTGNCIQSSLSAGVNILRSARALPLVDELIKYGAELVSTINEYESHPQLSRLPFTYRVHEAIGSCCPDWAKEVQKLAEHLHDKKSPAQAGDLENCLDIIAALDADGWQAQRDIANAAFRLIELRTLLQDIAGGAGDIKISYTLNSTALAGRDIIIRGKGCYHSRLEAGRDARVQGKLRGGTVVAGEKIYVLEVGSEAGAVTTLQVPAKGRIETDKSYENTIYVVGRNTIKTSSFNGPLRTLINEDARLVLIPRR